MRTGQAEITAIGDGVRQLKASGADKATIEAEVSTIVNMYPARAEWTFRGV